MEGNTWDSLGMYQFSVLKTLQFILKENNGITLLPWFLWTPRKGTTSGDLAIVSHFMQGLESHFCLPVFLDSVMVKMLVLIVNLPQCRTTWGKC